MPLYRDPLRAFGFSTAVSSGRDDEMLRTERAKLARVLGF